MVSLWKESAWRWRCTRRLVQVPRALARDLAKVVAGSSCSWESQLEHNFLRCTLRVGALGVLGTVYRHFRYFRFLNCFRVFPCTVTATGGWRCRHSPHKLVLKVLEGRRAMFWQSAASTAYRRLRCPQRFPAEAVRRIWGPHACQAGCRQILRPNLTRQGLT